MPAPDGTTHAPPVLALCLALAAVLAGCASATNTNTTAASLPRIAFSSPAIAAHQIPARYTCDGRNTNPPLQWGALPRNTGELLATLVGYQTTPAGRYTVTVEWALAGINPRLHHLDPGQRPPGSFPGLTTKNTHRYNICPHKHATSHYQFMLYALPDTVKLSHEFDTIEILPTITKPGLETSATAQGILPASYKRN